MAIGSTRSKHVAFCVHKLQREVEETVYGGQLLAVLGGVVRVYLGNRSRLDLGPGNLAYIDSKAVVEAPYDEASILLLSCQEPLHRKILLTDYALRCGNMLVYDATPPTIVDSHSIVAPLLAPVAVREDGGPAAVVGPGELVECRQKCTVKPLERPSRILVVVEE